MRLDYYVPVAFASWDTDEPVEPPRSLHGQPASELELADYLDYDMVDLGISGGTSDVVLGDDGTFVRVSFWSPAALDDATAERLTEYVRTQMIDGAGESGFDFEVDGERVVATPVDEAAVPLRQVEDGRIVLPANPVAIALRDGDAEAALAALRRNAGDALRPYMGFTPLHWSISHGDEAIVAEILKAGADPNHLDPSGMCGLISCIFIRGFDDEKTSRLATALLSAGADPQATYSETSAVDWATQREKPATAETIRQAVNAKS